jgi:hypothetical protein
MTSLSSAVVTAVALSVTTLESQPSARPDFSGTWAMDRERSESMHQGDAFEPPTVVIAQNEREIAIETQRKLSTSRTVYVIGARSAPADASKIAEPRAYWDGATLVTEAARTVQGQTVSVRETRSLDAAGAEMTVQTLLVVQHGYSFKGARNYGAAKDVYRRATP